MNTKILYSIIGVFVLVLAVVFFAGDGGSTPDGISNATDTPQQTADETTPPRNYEQTPDGWEAYYHEDFDFTFAYPSDARTDIENERVKVQLIGPEAEENTELTDGFTFYAYRQFLTPQTSVAEFAQKEYETETIRGESIESPHETTILGRTTHSFSVRTAMGNIATHVYIPAGDDQALIATYTISGDEDDSYQDMVNQMIGSLTLTQ